MTQVTPIHDLRDHLMPEQVVTLIAAAANPRDALLVRIPWRLDIRGERDRPSHGIISWPRRHKANGGSSYLF